MVGARAAGLPAANVNLFLGRNLIRGPKTGSVKG
jgi:hypothetical protein